MCDGKVLIPLFSGAKLWKSIENTKVVVENKMAHFMTQSIHDLDPDC